ncbi:MAG TPA: 2-hydroxyglutaryl-CoA dehydratase [Syntrophomonadaceae bacterium]|nr:2-hydroxyglutaryl-CoA dehydratase [Syntrophomonadaceae bacterium]
MNCYLGIDIGSVSSNFVLIDEKGRVLLDLYMRTHGNPIRAVQEGLALLQEKVDVKELVISGVGTTGSGRYLAAVLTGADVVKNEITAHAVAAAFYYPHVRTVIEIGGQDSKMILLKNGIVYDFAMNTVCAAGTGSFLDQQAARLQIPIEQFGGLAAHAQQPVRIAGRCGVFAESDMIHKQQMGYPTEDILMGLCEALVRNYLNNVGKGKKIEEPIVFQGGVAANQGLHQAFERNLGMKINIPPYYAVMGAMGAALLAREHIENVRHSTQFKGFDFIVDSDFQTQSFECKSCPNLCEVVSIRCGDQILAYWGDRCKRWESSIKMKHSRLKVI